MAEENTSTVQRTANLLPALGASDVTTESGLGVVDIARRIGWEKSQLSWALKALNEVGLVERDPHTFTYRLGRQFFALATNAGRQRLRTVGPPMLR